MNEEENKFIYVVMLMPVYNTNTLRLMEILPVLMSSLKIYWKFQAIAYCCLMAVLVQHPLVRWIQTEKNESGE